VYEFSGRTIADGVHVFVDLAHLTGLGSCAWEPLQNKGLFLAGKIRISGTQMLPS